MQASGKVKSRPEREPNLGRGRPRALKASENRRRIADRGWNHGGHRRIVDVVQQVADEHNRRDLMNLFGVAQALHTNFYEDWLDSDTVSIYMDDVRKLLPELEQIRLTPVPTFAPETREQRNRLQRLTRG